MDDKISWIKTELADEGFYLSDWAVLRTLEGEPPAALEDAVVDIITELSTEWGLN